MFLSLALTFLLGLPAGSVAANGNPVTIVLSYLQGVSTFGPTNATGVAELVPREGEVRLSATGLPRLENEEYQAWMANTASGEHFRLVAFNTNDAGVGRIDTVLPSPIPDGGWDLLLVSVEAQGSRPDRLHPRRRPADRRQRAADDRRRAAAGARDRPAAPSWVGQPRRGRQHGPQRPRQQPRRRRHLQASAGPRAG